MTAPLVSTWITFAVGSDGSDDAIDDYKSQDARAMQGETTSAIILCRPAQRRGTNISLTGTGIRCLFRQQFLPAGEKLRDVFHRRSGSLISILKVNLTQGIFYSVNGPYIRLRSLTEAPMCDCKKKLSKPQSSVTPGAEGVRAGATATPPLVAHSKRCM
jgi:hypothetical protein